MNNDELIKFCLENLNFKILNNWPPKEYCYPYISLCAIDAVFSINTKYEAVKNIVNRIEKSRVHLNSLAEFEKWMGNTPTEELKQNYFNGQKVGKRLKIDILKDFIDILLCHNFDDKADFGNFIDNAEIDTNLDNIKGVGKTTISYFFMLAGDENKIKPDRHIKKFISDRQETLINDVDNKMAAKTLKLILPELQKKHPKLTLRSLDYLIWNFQRKKTRRNN